MAVGLVAKVRNKASELYRQAKARYAGSDTMQKAGQQAGQAASRVTDRVRDFSGKAAASPMADKIRSGPMGDKIRDLSGKAAASPMADKIRSGPMGEKIRDLSGKAAAAMKDAQARRPEHK
ncbi:MAG TPA: hypothetical protein VME44_25740 [Streptosporangiaceae bacterium]|nr:hypothetical protein [Streptosporangiaceae bacterium]